MDRPYKCPHSLNLLVMGPFNPILAKKAHTDEFDFGYFDLSLKSKAVCLNG